MMTRHLFDRRQAILAMGAALTMSGTKQAVAADGDFAARLADMQRDGRVSGLHTLLVSRGGRLLFEYYGQGQDESWGTPLGKVTFGPTVLHDLRSVSKSVVGMLYGIALVYGATGSTNFIAIKNYFGDGSEFSATVTPGPGGLPPDSNIRIVLVRPE